MSARFAALLGLLFLTASAAAHEYSSHGVTVAHPWARATPGGATVGGAFFEMKAARGHSDRLIGAHSALARSAEVHKDSVEGGIAKMRRLDGIALREGTSVVLKPGGYHVMLMDLAAPLKEGDLLKLTLVFEKAGEIEVEATIEPVGATGPHGFDRQSVSKPEATHKH
jgi:periplasmic copper chaperone A